jgi:hypothetical protein
VRVFIWGSISENAIDLRPFSRTLRLIGAVGIGLITAFLLGLLFSDALRINAPLELLANDSSSTRGLSVPAFAIPLTLLAIAVGWGYMLAGALHARPLVRWMVLLVFMLQILFPLLTQIAALQGPFLLATAVAVLALVVCFVVLPRVALPLPLEWSMVLALSGTLIVIVLSGSLRLERISGTSWLNDMVSSILLSQFVFVVPFLVIAGLGWADFALEASRWITGAARRHATGAVLTAILLGALAYRLYGLSSAVGGLPDDEQLRAWGGAAILLAGLVAILLWRTRLAPGSAIPQRLIISLALLVPAVQILLTIAPTLIGVPALLNITPETGRQFSTIAEVVGQLSDLELRVRPFILIGAGLLLTWLGTRRGSPSLRTFGLIVAWTQLCTWLTGAYGPLTSLRFTYADVDALALVALTAISIVLLATRRLTEGRALRLLAIVVLMALLNQTDFLDNPFSPLFGFAGVAFLAFGIVWNILTAGNGFANADTPGLPRESRLLLYLGYVLLSVSISHWYLISHNIDMQNRQSTVNSLGFLTIGLPLAYLAIVELGEPLLRDGDEGLAS